ncbi:MAG TPA: MEDS domain-containing protein [Gemmatimonadaceae bacterium]
MNAPRLVYRQGDHACTLYTTREEQLSAATEYIRGGLERGERCLFICVEHDVPTFRAALKDAGIDADAEEQRGALVLMTKEEGHLQGGSFDPARMIHTLDVAVKNALAAGFTGLCAGGDMSWILEDTDSVGRLAEYEALLNRFYRDNRALGLCLYNRRTLSDSVLDHGLATHPVVRMEGPILLSNPFYEEPEHAARRKARPDLLDGKVAQLAQVAALRAPHGRAAATQL